ncbi:cupin domain-containing protein [Shewanella gelidii]|uniref:Cupin n=1 Tax=Shewanella gelidii TaxID=1642821 RepID=A0A917NCM8_9GAMM|nr:cupin domain-containing protein [Shewanella gelidii]MCL1099000.1 cupin domain-containing protein [Shewanella gelidii]GGI88951.1 cupin [Shewanella gelidii]
MYTPNFDIQAFLRQHWQKRPIVLKQGFTNFEDFIDANELAGLAMEEDISSRIVITEQADKQREEWQVIQGPFTDYQEFGETHWQLLVQAVNHWHPDANQLVQAFRFIPDWRFDDLMVSFATPFGGVGPHIDNYDVFIIQGQGLRRWQVGEKGVYPARGSRSDTPLIEDFEPMIDEVLEPGDILYIPPGFPHRGQTIETAISYSVGFRAPSQQELLNEFADYYLDNNLGQLRYESSSEPLSGGGVSAVQQQELLCLLTSLANDKTQYLQILGQILSQNRFELNIETGHRIDENELIRELSDGASLHRTGGVKIIWLEQDAESRLFVNGECYSTEGIPESNTQSLSYEFSFSSFRALELCQSPQTITLILQLINNGYLYLSDEY